MVKSEILFQCQSCKHFWIKTDDGTRQLDSFMWYVGLENHGLECIRNLVDNDRKCV